MKRFLIGLPDDLRKFLEEKAKRDGLTRNALIAEILRRWRKERKEEGT